MSFCNQPIVKTALVGLFLFSQSAMAWNIEQGELANWLNRLSPAPSVYQEMQKYFGKQGVNSAGSSNYITGFVGHVHQNFISKVAQNYQNSSNVNLKCKNSSVVDFPEVITSMKIGSKFESEALSVETMDCLGKLDHHKVFQTFLSDAFQINSVTGLVNIKSNQATNLVCQATDVFPVGKSSYCFTQNIWADATTYIIQSFNETNNPEAEAPVYFREVFTVIKKMPNGEVFIYNLALGRGPDLPLHFVVKSKVKSEQTKAINALKAAAK